MDVGVLAVDACNRNGKQISRDLLISESNLFCCCRVVTLTANSARSSRFWENCHGEGEAFPDSHSCPVSFPLQMANFARQHGWVVFVVL